MTRTRLLGLGAALILAGAIFSFALWQGAGQSGASVAFAQSGPSGTPTAPGTTSPPTQGTWTDMANAFWNSLASKLGLSADNLKSSVVAAEKDVIEQAVKDGKLTRAQADQLEQRLTTNALPAPFFGGMRGEFQGQSRGSPGLPDGHLGGVDTLEAIANALNMKPADLNAQLQSGKTLADIAKAQNVDQAKVKQAIVDAEKAQVQRQVQDGLITQAQADQILANLTPDNIDLSGTMWFGGQHQGQFAPGGSPHGGAF